MAEAALGRGISLPALRVRVVEWVLANREVVALAAIMSVAAALRFWDLGTMALHHDESLHAQYTWYLYEGRGYQHNPLMHGPFLFHSGALIFLLFGDSEMTARLLPALFGTILVGMPFLLRKQIGTRAALIAAVLLTFSPTLLYFSRFYRNDIYIAVWTFGMVICIWRYLDEVRSRYLCILAGVMALSFATKEVTFITVAIILLFLDIMVAIELGKRRNDEQLSDLQVALRTAALVPVAWLIVGLWPLFGKEPFGRPKLPPVGDLLVVAGTLALPQFAAAIQIVVGDKGYQVSAEDTLRVATVASLLVVSLYVELLWRPKTWAIIALCFYVPYVLLYTTFFFNMDGFFSGIWGSLDYWLAQQDVRRGSQPVYYYALMTPLYEFLPLLLAALGSVWIVLRGDSLKRWLLFWLVAIFTGLTLAGEKMPWLETHIALPLALVAAVALSKAFDVLGVTWERGRVLLAAGILSACCVLLLVDGDGPWRIAGVVAAVLLAIWLLSLVVQREPGDETRAVGRYKALGSYRSLGRGLLSVAVAALLALTVRAAITAAFTHRDIPVEMLVYTQTSPDIPKIRDRIDTIAKKSGLGYNLPIVVDGADSFAWPWAWYLRNYHDVSFVSVSADYKPPAGAVLLVSRNNATFIDSSQYTETPYKHRWWFCESYRNPQGLCLTSGGLSLNQAVQVATDPDKLRSIANFFLYRRDPATSTGSVDGVAFFPNDLSAYDAKPGPAVPPREPTKLADGRILLGSAAVNPGNAVRGEFNAPADLFVDDKGNLWVADGRNNRIQKFDSNGNFIASFGKSGNGPGSFNEPWSVAVDKDGFIYVADTWNHRIQKFSSNFDFVTMWGTPGANNPGPLDFFGPRDIAIAADGTIWMTDTGNERLLHFTNDGQSLGAFGGAGNGPGQFAEPVGLGMDAKGDLLVADDWNARVQVFSPDLQPVRSFSTGWTSHDVQAKPYITALADGRVLITEPENGDLVLYSSSGAKLGSWQPLAESMPVGVTALPDGGFAFSDIRRSEVQIVPASLVDGFFK